MNRKFTLFIFFFFPILYSYSQIQISGYVKDSLNNKSIPNLYVFISNSKNQLLKFQYTDSAGFYSINFNSKDSLYFLQINHLSFTPIVEEINVYKTQQSFVKNFNLTPREEILNEVVVNSLKKIYKNEDTTFINVKYYNTGTEKNLEDVLKNLPGIEVSESGTITVNNKKIEKVMIEGDDFLGEGYTLLTRNLTSKAIEQIQILDKYSNNKILKGVENSNKVALNIKLKDEFLIQWFGDAQTDLDVKKLQYNSLGANVHSYSKKSKFFFFTDLNSIGEDNTLIIYPFLKQNDEENERIVMDDFKINNLVSLNPPIIGIGNNTFNNDKIVSLNSIFNIGSKLKIKPIVYAQDYSHKYFKNSQQNFNFNNQKFINNEINNFNQTGKDYFTNLVIDYDINSKNNLVGNILIGQLNQSNKNNIIFNEKPSFENAQQDLFFQKYQLKYSTKTSKQSALLFLNEYSYNSSPQSYSNSLFNFPFLFDNLKTNSIINGSQQNSKIINLNFLSEIKYYLKNTDGNNLVFSLGFYSNNNKISNQIKFNDTINNFYDFDSLNNNYNFQQTQLIYSIKWLLKASKKIGFIINTNLLQTYFQINNLKPQHFSNGNILLGLKYKQTKQNEWFLGFLTIKNNITNKDILGNYFLSSFRSMQKGTSELQFLYKNIVNIKFEKKYSLNHQLQIEGSYINEPLFVGFSSAYYSQYSIQKIKIFNNKTGFNGIYSHQLFINKLSTKLNWKLNYESMNYTDEVNNFNRNIQRDNYSFDLYFRNITSSKFNWSMGLNYNKIIFKTNNYFENNIWQLSNNIQYIPNYKFYIQVENKWYKFIELISGNSFLLFTNLDLNYNIFKEKLNLNLKINNILNIDEFKIFNVNDFSTETVNYIIQPQIIQINLTTNF